MTLKAARLAEITAGDELAMRIKNVSYPQVEWSKCWYPVGCVMAEVKKRGKVFHPDLTEVQLIRVLCDYSDQDLQELLENIPSPPITGLGRMLERAITPQV
jgi:hypothetical protein